MAKVEQMVHSEPKALAIAREEVSGGRTGSARGHGQAAPAVETRRPEEADFRPPVDELPLFLDQLRPMQEPCLSHGRLREATVGAIVLMDQGEQIVLQPPERLRERRQSPRVAVRYAVLCQPLPTELSPRPMILRAEFRDLSVGGAQIHLPCRLGLGQQVELAGWIEEQPFRARAEVVGAELPARQAPLKGPLRHSLKWLTYNGAAADILTMTWVQLPGDPCPAPETEGTPEASAEPISAGSATGC